MMMMIHYFGKNLKKILRPSVVENEYFQSFYKSERRVGTSSLKNNCRLETEAAEQAVRQMKRKTK